MSPAPLASAGGGSIGGGGGGGIALVVSNPSVHQVGLGIVEVNWYTNYPATGQVFYATTSVATTTGMNFGYSFATDKVMVASTTHRIVIAGLTASTTYYFRPVSGFLLIGYADALGRELSITPPSGKGAPVEVRSPMSGCPYLTSYLGQNFNNNMEEVFRLQNFLKIRAGIAVNPTGVFDAQTEAGVHAFQTRYADDILRPWAEDQRSTGYVYITTKRKINEMMCGRATLTLAEVEAIAQHREVPKAPPVELKRGEPTIEPVPIIGLSDKKLSDIATTATTTATSTNRQFLAAAYTALYSSVTECSFCTKTNFLRTLVILLIISAVGVTIYLNRRGKDDFLAQFTTHKPADKGQSPKGH